MPSIERENPNHGNEEEKGIVHNRKEEELINFNASPLIESRQDSYKSEEMHSAMVDRTNEQTGAEGRQLPPLHKVRFNTNRQQSPAPGSNDNDNNNSKEQIDIAKRKEAPTPTISIFPGKAILASILSAKPRVKKHTDRQSVFERLARAETVASIHQKFRPGSRPKRSTSAPPPMRRYQNMLDKNFQGTKAIAQPRAIKPAAATTTTHTKSTNQRNFERLANRHTVASSNRKYRGRDRSSSTDRTGSLSRRQRGSQEDARKEDNAPRMLQPSPLERNTSENAMARPESRERDEIMTFASPHTSFYSRKRAVEDDETIDQQEADYIDARGPPMVIEFSSRTKIFCKNKYEPDEAAEEIDPIQLNIRRFLTEYEAGMLNPREISSHIINALLWRDLPEQIMWDVQYPLERELAMPIGEVGFSLFIEATEAKNDDDTEDDFEHTASATGNVMFLPDRWEIHVENYSCVHDVEDDDISVG